MTRQRARGAASQARRNLDVLEVGAWRRGLVLLVFCAGALVLLARAFQLQVLDREFLQREGDRRALRTVKVPAFRGAIRDRYGEPLALSAPVDSIWAVPSALLEAPEYLGPLAKLVEMKPRELTDFLEERREKQFAYLRRHMAPADATRVMALKAPGVFLQREYRRYYPAGEVAGHLVGFCNIDGDGLEGMEVAHDDSLRGLSGARSVIRSRDGRIVEDLDETVEAQPGAALDLTIDLRLQYLAYRELKAAVQAHDARGGLVVIADARTGELLAIANQPGFNPNRLEDRDSAGTRNRAATDVFEPGSAVKPLVVAQALERRIVRPDVTFETGDGNWRVSNHTVRDVRGYGTIGLGLLLSKSSNIGSAMLGMRMGAHTLHDGYAAFGFGTPVYSGFPGEALGVFREWSGWGLVETATAAYGYGVSVTALHLVRAYAGLANDGLMPQLGFVLGADRGESQRAVSAETARAVRRLMEGAVSREGTASLAAIPGYRIAGKTGTVRKVGSGGYAADRHQSLFIGMLPAENPRLVGLVMIDEPGGEAYYGGAVAAPVFRAVMQEAARLLRLPPDPECQRGGATLPAHCAQPAAIVAQAAAPAPATPVPTSAPPGPRR